MASALITPVSGSTTNGSSAVTVNGTTCVIHHVAIHHTSPAVVHACGSMPAGAGRMRVSAKPSTPMRRPQMFCTYPLFRFLNSPLPC